MTNKEQCDTCNKETECIDYESTIGKLRICGECFKTLEGKPQTDKEQWKCLVCEEVVGKHEPCKCMRDFDKDGDFVKLDEKPQTESLSDKRKNYGHSGIFFWGYPEEDVREKIGDFNKELKERIDDWYHAMGREGVLKAIDELALKHFGEKLI